MSTEFSRMDRINVLMVRSLTHIVRHEVKDPRLSKWITISDISISKDLRHAKVYFTILNDDPVIAESILNTAAGHIRRLLSKSSNLRNVPDLRFVYDDSVSYGHRLSHLIDEANATESDDDKN